MLWRIVLPPTLQARGLATATMAAVIAAAGAVATPRLPHDMGAAVEGGITAAVEGVTMAVGEATGEG